MKHTAYKFFSALAAFVGFYAVLFVILSLISAPAWAYYRSYFFEYLPAAVLIAFFAVKGYWISVTVFCVGSFAGYVINLAVVARQTPYVTMKGGMLAVLCQIIALILAVAAQLLWMKRGKKRQE